jgi:hypothetical protein
MPGGEGADELVEFRSAAREAAEVELVVDPPVAAGAAERLILQGPDRAGQETAAAPQRRKPMARCPPARPAATPMTPMVANPNCAPAAAVART